MLNYKLVGRWFYNPVKQYSLLLLLLALCYYTNAVLSHILLFWILQTNLFHCSLHTYTKL